MIKFFRHIRKKLISENKMGKPTSAKASAGKYFKYAIGEIILVMIGILLALQVNNWNDNRIAKKDSKAFLQEMLLDLAMDTAYINNAIKKIENQLVYIENVLSRTKHGLQDLDSLDTAAAGNYFDFYITDRTFQKIQNNAQSKLIGFDTLYKSISNYYTYRKSRMQKNTEYEIKLSDELSKVWQKFYNSIEPAYATYTREINGQEVKKSFPALTSKEEEDTFFLNFYNSIEGRNTLRQLYSRRLFSLRGFKTCKEDADELLMSINTALNND